MVPKYPFVRNGKSGYFIRSQGTGFTLNLKAESTIAHGVEINIMHEQMAT